MLPLPCPAFGRRLTRPLASFVLSLAPSLLAADAPAATPRKAPPNIVIVFSDDHAWQAISAYGDARKLIETPNIDRIAREGVRFDRCLVPNPLCGPSRATVLTGTYNHINGFVNNTNRVFDGSQVTFPKLLQAAGYQTAIIGKWHLGSDPTGFDHWNILPGQGRYYNPGMILNGRQTQVPGYVTDIITDRSIEWLERRDKSKPFLLLSHHKAPHATWLPALRHLHADNDRVYPEPPTLFDDYSGRGVAERDQDVSLRYRMDERDLKLVPPGELTPEQRTVWDAYYGPRNAAFHAANLSGNDLLRWIYQRFLHDYLACVRSVDESVGRLLQYLDQEKLAENTIIIYASDQGFFLGEHGWLDKRWIFEESVRTPFVLRWPAEVRPGTVNRNLVSTLDFAQTILDAAGLPQPDHMQGRSLLPLLRDETVTDWRRSFFYQYFEYPGWNRVRPHEGVITDRYKLVHFFGTGEDYWELFDRETDPHELTSVYGRADYAAVQTELHAELQRLRADYKVPDQIPDDWYGTKTQYPPTMKRGKSLFERSQSP